MTDETNNDDGENGEELFAYEKARRARKEARRNDRYLERHGHR